MTEHPADNGNGDSDDLRPFEDASEVAERQFEEIYNGPDIDLANAVSDAWDLIMQMPAEAQVNSGAIRAQHGSIILRYPVSGYDMAVFWTTAEPRIEAIFPHP